MELKLYLTDQQKAQRAITIRARKLFQERFSGLHWDDAPEQDRQRFLGLAKTDLRSTGKTSVPCETNKAQD